MIDLRGLAIGILGSDPIDEARTPKLGSDPARPDPVKRNTANGVLK